MPLAGRCAWSIHMALLPYARPERFGSYLLSPQAPRAALWAAGVLAAVAWGLHGDRGLAHLGGLHGRGVILSAYVYRKIGGATGDTLGAICEVVEIVPALVLTLGPLAGAK